MKTLSIAATRLIRLLLSLVNRGGSLPGQIGLKIDSKALISIKSNLLALIYENAQKRDLI